MGQFLTTAEFAALVRAPVESVRYWRFKDYGPPSFKIGRRVLYRSEDVAAWLDEQYAQSGTGGPRAAA